MRLNQQPPIKKESSQFARVTLSNTFGGAKIKMGWKIYTKRSGILTSSLKPKKNNRQKVLLCKMWFLLFLIPLTSNGQVLIDTCVIQEANHYLVKGAIARRQVTILRKIVTSDSVIIDQQDSIIGKQNTNIAYLKDDNNALVKRNKAISRTLISYKMLSVVLTILSVVMWLK